MTRTHDDDVMIRHARAHRLYLKTARLDGIEIKSAWDSGFQEGRQFGRRPNNRGLGGAAAAPLGADGKRPAKRFKREQKVSRDP